MNEEGIVGQMQLKYFVQARAGVVIHSTTMMMTEELTEWVLSYFLDTILENPALNLRDLEAA